VREGVCGVEGKGGVVALTLSQSYPPHLHPFTPTHTPTHTPPHTHLPTPTPTLNSSPPPLSHHTHIHTHRATSVINGVTYLPWSDADLSELRIVSSLPQDYKDPVGLIPLATKQKAQLGGWMRPHDICDNPKMVHLISSLTIKQVICIL